MPSTLMTPGVYIEEKNAFPSSAVSVETAVPVFIGYTEVAERNGKTLLHTPTRITSFAEYHERFGGKFKPKFSIDDANPVIKQNTFNMAGADKVVTLKKDNTAYMYNSIRLFYANGGGPAYIISVGTYLGKDNFEIKADDFLDSDTQAGPLTLLEKEFEPTLIVMPDAIALGSACYNSIYTKVLDHCGRMQSRFGIFDLAKQEASDDTSTIVEEFRNDIGINFLSYGAAYYPWLKSAVVQPSEVNFENLDPAIKLDEILPEFAAQQAAIGFAKISINTIADSTIDDLTTENTKQLAAATAAQTAGATGTDQKKKDALDKKVTDVTAVKTALTKAKTDLGAAITALATAQAAVTADDKADTAKTADLTKALKTASDTIDTIYLTVGKALNVQRPTAFKDMINGNFDTAKTNYHQALKATSPTYVNIMEEIRASINELPPSGAIAGLYTMVDSSRGVWKSPANVSVNMVNAPSVNISNEGQETLNVDAMAGKSINVIRPFPGIGSLVWGGRTLDGNSQDWRYINVRRTMIMIEQSLKLASRAYVFEPNDANTWITVKSMMSNFLTNLWKQGALAGAAPEQAFDVQIGLGSTMTPTDILDGKMLITVKVAVVRPAEFIVITFQQQMQQS